MENFLIVWSLCAIGSFPLLMVIDHLVTVSRGPEFMLWLQRHSKKSTSNLGPVRWALIWLACWWFFLILWMRAARRGHTLKEEFILRQQEKAEALNTMQNNEHKARRRIMDALGAPQGRVWFAPHTDSPFHPYVRAEAHQTSLICTHFVVFDPSDNETLVFRMCVPLDGEPPAPGDQDSDYTGFDLKEAIQWCEDDIRWSELCLEGTEQQRSLFRKGLYR